MNKNIIRNTLLVSIILLIISAFTLFCLLYVKNNKKPVYLEDVKVSVLVEKYNNNLKKAEIECLATEEKFLKEDDGYWYGLHEDIVLHIIPTEYTGDLEKDIVLESSIFYDKNSKNKELANKYIFELLKTNLPELSNEDFDEIIKQAKEIGKDNVNSKKGKGYASNGLIVTYWINENDYHFCIEREREVLDEKSN